VVLLSGEPGIGKSRLTAALLEAVASEAHTRLRNFCSPQHIDSALHPIIGRIQRAAGFAYDDAAQAKLDKLDSLLAQSSTSLDDAAVLAEMLSLPNDGRYPLLDLTPQQRRQKTLEALVLQVAALARQKTVLMIFEDAHWADPTSLELFGRIVDKILSLRALLVVSTDQSLARRGLDGLTSQQSSSTGSAGAKSLPSKRATCLLQFTAGSRKGLTRAI
jgi:predicted ATPase